MMNRNSQEKFGILLDFTLSVVVSLIVSIGLPFLFSRLLGFAVSKNGTGGGMFWLPSRPDEILWALGGLLFSLPFFVSLVALGLPITWLLDILGFQLGFDFYPPAWARMPTLIGNSIIAVSIAEIFQILFWLIAVHWIRGRFTKSRRARNI
jgi:hypothetical protein